MLDELHILSFLYYFLYSPRQEECLFWEVVILTRDQFLEAADRLFQGDEFTFESSELFSNVEWLRKEPLNLTRTSYRQFIFFRQFVNPKNCNNILQVLVPLEDAFNLLRYIVMLLAYDAWVENSGG